MGSAQPAGPLWGHCCSKAAPARALGCRLRIHSQQGTFCLRPSRARKRQSLARAVGRGVCRACRPAQLLFSLADADLRPLRRRGSQARAAQRKPQQPAAHPAVQLSMRPESAARRSQIDPPRCQLCSNLGTRSAAEFDSENRF